MQLNPVGLWVTPKTQAELQDLVEGLGSPEAIHAMMFTWNYIAYLIKYEDENGTKCEGCELDCMECVCPEPAPTRDNHCTECGSDLTV